MFTAFFLKSIRDKICIFDIKAMNDFIEDAPPPAKAKPAVKAKPSAPKPAAHVEKPPEEPAGTSAQDIADALFKDAQAGANGDPLDAVDDQDLADFLFKQMKDNK